ncbi:MAG: agmatinase [Thermoplasmata archaeon]
MGARPTVFADARAARKGAGFVILGVPYDTTSSFRPGARFAPNAIREASWNFETYLPELGVDLTDIQIHDAGNLEEVGPPEELVEEVRRATEGILDGGSFPVLLGGEHSLTPGAVGAMKEKVDIGVIVLDAHMDFRNEYLRLRHSHACATRRCSELVGPEAVVPIGVRSVSREEMEDINGRYRGRFKYIGAEEVRRGGIGPAVRKALRWVGRRSIYLSLDMDALDPAYAPATGTPEPFGLTPWDVRDAIRLLAPRLVGFDIVEISPGYDTGNTAALGARLVRELMAAVHGAREGR